MSDAWTLRTSWAGFATALALAALPVLTGTGASAANAVRAVPEAPAAKSIELPDAGAGAPTRDAPPAAPAARADLSVTVDRAKVIRLPQRAQTVIVGNPAIADIAIQKNGVVVLTGKSYGVTNLIAIDNSGSVLAESTVTVGAPNDATLTVQRGLDRQTYSCNPACQPSIQLGDSTSYFSENKGQAEQHNQFATQR